MQEKAEESPKRLKIQSCGNRRPGGVGGGGGAQKDENIA